MAPWGAKTVSPRPPVCLPACPMLVPTYIVDRCLVCLILRIYVSLSGDNSDKWPIMTSIRRVSSGNPTAENLCDSRQVRTTLNEAVTSNIALSDRLTAESSSTSASRGSRHLTGTSSAYTPPFVIFHSGSLKSRATREAVSSSLRPIHHQPTPCCPLNHPRQQAHKAIHPRTNPRLGGQKDLRPAPPLSSMDSPFDGDNLPTALGTETLYAYGVSWP